MSNLIEEKHHKFYNEYEKYVEKKRYENTQIVAKLKRESGSHVGVSFVQPYIFSHWLHLKFKKGGTAKC